MLKKTTECFANLEEFFSGAKRKGVTTRLVMIFATIKYIETRLAVRLNRIVGMRACMRT